MDIEKNLVFLYDNKIESLIDKTEQIVSIFEYGGKARVVFNNNKAYDYNSSKVKWIKNPVEIKLFDKIVLLNGIQLFSIKKLVKFGDWYRVFYQNNHKVYHITNLDIKRTIEAKPIIDNTFDYMRRVAEFFESDNDRFLASQIEKLRPIEGCMLEKFLEKAKIQSVTTPKTFIYPFGCNYSQMQAVKNAFCYNFSVIQGPPGTGKTQTILNIIANALLYEKTVAVVAGNNEATRNILEKLEKNNLDFLTAFLGNRANIEQFFLKSHSIPNTVNSWIDFSSSTKQNDNINFYLKAVLDCQMQIAKIKNKMADLKAEKVFSDNSIKGKSLKIPKKILSKRFSSINCLGYAASIDIVSKKQRIGFFTKLKHKFKYGLWLNKNRYCFGDIIDYLQNKYYELKLGELDIELKHKERFVESYTELQKLSEQLGSNILYRAIAKKFLNDKFAQNDNFRFDMHNYRFRFVDFCKRYPIIFSTTHALQSCTGQGFLYDYLIIDEASQVDVLTACLAFAFAKNIVLVGDKMQLPHVVKANDIPYLKALFESYDIPKEIEYCSHSILDASTEIYKDDLPSCLLNEHYRCDPYIIGFCNKKFYNDSLIVQTTHKSDTCGIKIITTEAHHFSNNTNIRQAEIIKRDIMQEIDNFNDKSKNQTIGIITPYRNQVELLNKYFKDQDILIDTVHKFQGKEKDIIILSTVSDQIKQYEDERIDFLNNANLINVAISRAKSTIYVVASTKILEQDGSLIADLAKYNEYYCKGVSRHTKVYSVFDLMFCEYTKKLNQLKSRLLQISQYQSENIIATVIDDICKSKQFGALKFYHNYRLRNILNINFINDYEDLKFVKNANTHCDFVIFDLLDKEIKLVIEVDGRQHNQQIQKSRDERKDRLLQSAGLKILRLPTTEIECKEKIEKALQLVS